MAGIFTQETMNNLAGPQRKNGTRSRELEHRTGCRFEQYYTQLVADAGAVEFVAPPREKLPEKIFSPDTNPQRHPQHLCPRESRLDAIYEHLRRAALLSNVSA
jgi:hypothetical protein